MRFSIIVLALLTFVSSAIAQPRAAATNGAKVLRDLPYVENGHQRNKLDLYLPQDAKGPLPVVVWIHGGAWWAGSKDGCRAAWLTGRGYAVASVNYRLSQHAVFPAQIEDCKAAIRWLRANAGKYHLDADHIGVWGESAGGHLVAMLGTAGGVKELEGTGGNADKSSHVQCVVDWFGPTDLVRITEKDDKPDGPVAKLIGGRVHDNREKAKKASPLYYVDKDSAPFLIMHGDKDKLVPLEQSEILADALSKAGVEAKLQVIKDNGHGGPGFTTPESRKMIEEFFDKHLKGKDGGGRTGATQKKPRVLVTISKETTYITGPLRKDGYPDYVAALNEQMKKGVTPENNSAVLFWQAMGPEEIAPKLRARFFTTLEMHQPPENGDYFVSSDKYFQRLRNSKDPRLPHLVASQRDPVWDQFNEAMERPWSRERFPALAGWLAANEKPLGLLVRATKRSLRYDPLLCTNSDHELVLGVLLFGADQSRELGRALERRATLRLGNGKLDEAWDDLLACHRLGRLEGQGPTLVEALVAVALDSIACAGDQAVLQTATLSSKQIAKMRDDLEHLPPMPKMADKIDIAERFVFLDCLRACAREGFEMVISMEADLGRKSNTPLHSWLEEKTWESLDWNLIFRMGNSWYDRMVSVSRLPSGSARSAAVGKFDKDVRALDADSKDLMSLRTSTLTGSRRQAVSEKVGRFLVGLLLPAASAAVKAEDRGTMQFEVTKLGFALAAYHADHGAYPKQLIELSPRYVAKLPGDVFAGGGPLRYEQKGAGYLLYSVGPNGNDDRGRGINDCKGDETWDDISTRVP
jgi:acetyl esterase/lipase